MQQLDLLHLPGVCPALVECKFGGPGAPPICDTYCGMQHGAIWKSIPDTLGWPERNALYEARRHAELHEVSS